MLEIQNPLPNQTILGCVMLDRAFLNR